MTPASPLKMQDREKWSCQILKGGCWAHRDGRPVVRRTFLAGLEACLFTKVDVLLQAEENIEKVRGKCTNSYATFIRYEKAWKQPCTVLYQRVEYSIWCGLNHAANLTFLTAIRDFLKGFIL